MVSRSNWTGRLGVICTATATSDRRRHENRTDLPDEAEQVFDQISKQ